MCFESSAGCCTGAFAYEQTQQRGVGRHAKAWPGGSSQRAVALSAGNRSKLEEKGFRKKQWWLWSLHKSLLASGAGQNSLTCCFSRTGFSGQCIVVLATIIQLQVTETQFKAGE